ncbi:DUF58 domain-containing protein [Kutzneria sp. 744]|uniref:DUF58 domain-containing protein n=1 Tax=Kutzneria sp. (strain 744) TaxID=345341 RepID=UPI0003EEA777|nr:DUF58 domain-containing protein [Kutzneria sp. 744]EWM17114.1 LigA protein [Kutzneria sp. 744]
MSNRAERIRAALAGGRNETWHGTETLRRALLLGVGLVVVGVIMHLVELVLIGAPLLISGVLAMIAPPAGEPKVKVTPPPRTAESADTPSVVVEIEPSENAELLAIRLPSQGVGGPGRVHLLPATVLRISAPLRRKAWGEGVDVRVDHLLAGPEGMVVHGPMVGSDMSRTVLPPLDKLPVGPLPPRPAGLVGAHRSRRPGDGVELRDIRPFQPGDRLRGIDWRISLRSNNNELYVRERHATADADIVLALDTRSDVVPELADWSVSLMGATVRPGGSMDTSVRAAVSLAASYLRLGDRVGLVDLGRPQLGLKPGVGRRQLLRLRNQVVVCAAAAGWSASPVLNEHQVPHGAVVVVLSPFLDDAIVQVAVHAARRGNRVLAVDVLPQQLIADKTDRWGEAVRRMLLLEHSARLTALRDRGVAVMSWSDGASIADLLRRVRR